MPDPLLALSITKYLEAKTVKPKPFAYKITETETGKPLANIALKEN